MDAGWASIIVALIAGPLMWSLYRIDKRNTSQHGESLGIIKDIKQDVTEVKEMQVWMDLKLDRHIDEGHKADAG